MEKINKNLFDQITNQMSNRARDIDLAIYNSLFLDLEKEVVLDAISMYLNEDGGFGHGLELDNLNPNSTAVTTCIGLDIIKLVGFNSSCNDTYFKEVINGCFKYLFKTMKSNRWEFSVRSNNDYPCASWFKYDGKRKPNNNPTAKVLGHAIYFLNNNSKYYNVALSMVENVLTKLCNTSYMDKHEIDCYNVLLDSLKSKNITSNLIKSANIKLFELKKSLLNSNTNDFCNYENSLPLELFDDYVGDSIDELINNHLDYLVLSLPQHGLWEANFRWGNDYPQEESALLKWMGCITYKNMYLLKKFNRLE